MDIPRSEHPQPQFKRDAWLNLNGVWTYELDFGKSGIDRKRHEAKGFANAITVPFCPESELSGVKHTDFIEAMFYHRKLTIPAEWKDYSRFLLHFGAVDYIADIYINGKQVGHHVGGSVAFTVDISQTVAAGETYDLVVAVKDELRTLAQGGGKQSLAFASHGCSYTRTTGIWQTVYLEAAGAISLDACRITPDFDDSRFIFTPTFSQNLRGTRFAVDVKADGKQVAHAEGAAVSGNTLTVAIPDARAWSPEDPYLYDIDFTVKSADGAILDTVHSYGGLRKVHIEGNRLFINNKPLFLRQVLDQGFYEQGIWTAPTAEALENDIKLSMACGFNSARLHQKVFEPLFHYYADKLGYLTWAEYPSWGMACSRFQYGGSRESFHKSAQNHLREWSEAVQRDANHPSIIAWSPQNETAPAGYYLQEYRDYMTQLYDLTKALDPMRPVNDSSGYYHVKTDLWTTHRYSPDAQALRKILDAEGEGKIARNFPATEAEYAGQPFMVDEWGGFRYIPAEKRDSTMAGWGYHGLVIETYQQLLDKISEQIDVLLTDANCVGYCYTQLTDIEQEQNGVLSYDRTPKAPLEEFAKLFGKTKEL